MRMPRKIDPTPGSTAATVAPPFAQVTRHAVWLVSDIISRIERAPECVAIKQSKCRKSQFESETAEAVAAADGILSHQLHADQTDEITMRLRRRVACAGSKTFEVERLPGVEQGAQEFQSNLD